jgi:Na+/proline symporter
VQPTTDSSDVTRQSDTARRGLSAASLALGILSLVGSQLLVLRFMVRGAIPLPNVLWAIVGMFLVFSALAGLPAIVAGILALVRKRPGKSMAVAGLVTGSLGAILWSVEVITFILRTPI